MTKTLPLLLLLACLATSATAQSRVHEKDLAGAWKMVFQLDHEIDEADGAFARIALKAVSGIMDEIDIRFEFLSEHRLKVTSRALGEDQDVEYSTWRINDRGQLELGDTEHMSTDDDVWMFEHGVLVPYELENHRLVRQDAIRLERM